MSFLDMIKMKAVEGVKGFMIGLFSIYALPSLANRGAVIDMWLARHTPENTMPIIENVLKEVREEYGDRQYTVSHGTHCVGYCFGGKYALKLAGTNEVIAAAVAHGLVPPDPLRQWAYMLSGTMISTEDMQGIRKPVTFACVGRLSSLEMLTCS